MDFVGQNLAKNSTHCNQERGGATSHPFIKYLGLNIDNHLNFKQQVEHACTKASSVIAALSGLMLNVERQKWRALLASVIISVLMNGASIWDIRFPEERWTWRCHIRDLRSDTHWNKSRRNEGTVTDIKQNAAKCWRDQDKWERKPYNAGRCCRMVLRKGNQLTDSFSTC